MLRKPQFLLLISIALLTWAVAQAQSGRRSTGRHEHDDHRNYGYGADWSKNR
jgi:hypothetical protein